MKWLLRFVLLRVLGARATALLALLGIARAVLDGRPRDKRARLASAERAPGGTPRPGTS